MISYLRLILRISIVTWFGYLFLSIGNIEGIHRRNSCDENKQTNGMQYNDDGTLQQGPLALLGLFQNHCL